MESGISGKLNKKIKVIRKTTLKSFKKNIKSIKCQINISLEK